MDQSRLIEFTQDLVRLPSLSGAEEAVARRVEAEMRTLHFDQIWTDANGSVVGIIDGAEPGKTLLFDAHTDTVGISPGVPWRHDPFGAQIEGDAIFGRGAADMKGALAAMVYAAASIDRTRLKGRVVVSASTLEEVLEGVALQAVMDAAPPDFVVIGESTNLNLSRGGRGRAEVHLTTTGRPAHSSSPHLGRNAVLDMMAVIAAVEAIPLADDPFMGPAIFALTDIVSQPYPGHSVIPSICLATYDRRLLPGETAASVLGAITDRLASTDINLRAEIGLGEYQASPAPFCAARSSSRPGSSLKQTHSLRRRCMGCTWLVCSPRPAPTASAPTRPTAPGWLASPPSALARPPKPTPM